MENGEIDSITCELAQLEPLPSRPYPLPSITPHLLNRLIKNGHKGKINKVRLEISLYDLQKEALLSHKIIESAIQKSLP